MADPFLSAQQDLLNLLDQSRTQLQSYLRIRSSATNSPELIEARQELEATLVDLGADLQDLVDSVKAVEGDPARYGLKREEVERRRKLVTDVATEVDAMHHQLDATVHRQDAQKAAAKPTVEDGDPLAGRNDDDDDDDDDYGAWEEQRQMKLMREQDDALDGVFSSVGVLRMQADAMGRELEEQADLLDDTENIADRVGGKLQRGLKGMKYVIEHNEDRWSTLCIGGLIFVLIILLVLVVAI
ncbi:hypothetical protein K470DRAFT_280386 [Piedraia hortae CBS 480.64]|uniref:t-SNARE affecting a late Golgi compartment protein 1 n=1 Tax=Piedraia hortae CBS 480.64 TaxID=1314780 RepID=A0A6A7C774_9PEZI|nr:hypothetical protein K470DRAFT_280386 [Piedraia hortae CBS 480.64]